MGHSLKNGQTTQAYNISSNGIVVNESTTVFVKICNSETTVSLKGTFFVFFQAGKSNHIYQNNLSRADKICFHVKK
jgi:hypothetical protein